MRATPGPLPTDGTPLPNPEQTLTTFVEGTHLDQFGDDSFDDGIGLWYSATEPPPIPRRGQLWFKRGEGRLYQYHTAIPEVPAFEAVVGASNHTGANSAFGFGGSTGQWQCLSDRRQIFALYYEEVVINPSIPGGPFHNTAPGDAVVLGPGGIEPAAVGWNTDTILTALSRASSVIGSPAGQWIGPRLRHFETAENQSKIFFSTANTTYSGHMIVGAMFHDVGFARFRQRDETFGDPTPLQDETNSAIYLDSFAPDGALFPLAFALQSAYVGRFNV